MRRYHQPIYATHAYSSSPRPVRGLSLYAATALQLLVALFALWLTRFGFYACNHDLTGLMSVGQLARAAWGGLRFDISAVAYFNALFILMRLWPSSLAWKRGWIIAGNCVYTLCNSLLLALSIGDIPYYRFTGSRLRWHGFTSLWDDPNMTNIVFSYMQDYWWAYALAALCIALVACVAFMIRIRRVQPHWGSKKMTAVLRVIVLLIGAGLTFLCMRGRVGSGYPLSIGDAVWYADSPAQVNVVLNTPFSMLRSMSKDYTVKPLRFFSDSDLARLRSSQHTPREGREFSRKNVVIITVESGGSLWLDSQAALPLDRQRRGLMPFLDSLAQQSVSVRHAFGSGKMSIEGVTALYTGVPAYKGFLYLSSPYSGNKVDAPARLLREEGYASKFYFGGAHGSYGIDHLMHVMGFDQVTSRETYGPDAPYDGHWGIYDHAVAQFMAEDLSRLPQPFIAGWFTLNPHGPWDVPEDWRADGYKSRPNSMERVVEYEDRAIRYFFELASKQPWYDNTLFVITGDHGCRDLAGTEWDTDWVQPHIMMMFYTPDGSLTPRLVEDAVAAQCDLAPTLLGLLGYPHPFTAVGRDIFSHRAGYAVTCLNGVYQVEGTRYLVKTDGDMSRITAVYDIQADPKARRDLLPQSRTARGSGNAKGWVNAPESAEYDAVEVNRMAAWGRAFMQDYTRRLVDNELSSR